MTTRREFIKQTGILSSAMLIAPAALFKPKYKLGLQLYTVNQEMAKDVKATLKTVASLGYKEVETYGFNKLYSGFEPKVYKQILDDNNLTTPAGHYELNKFMIGKTDDDLKKYVDECIIGAHILKQDYIVWPWLDLQSRTIDKFKLVAAKLNVIGEQIKKAGLQLAYHNHDFEFIKHNGEIGYDIILNETDASLVKMEMDLYWTSHSSALSPNDWFKKQPGRFVILHLKDMDKKDRELHTVVGEGTIDFKSILKDAELAGVKHVFVEQGNNYVPNAFDCIARSAAYTKKHLL
jgi:sugar phosphate isomerase/epimerase